ncbi:MAG: aminotransferase class I/II-fold pyridoxal phosphate-dependent enzyme [Acidobacteriota bacterium]|nr:aminotransferase class I/II-fold pyridoxal phosphate-dependent enzyme [Acidobacteriota bacterium]MDE3031386.1 aminotransferase class I/II-fold pyridoxal phosphate-dependent enzyme [Acidobacteriota bacterium]MDE3138476.1 aminotransferase class I/II-fold pyridoxal phosphate-dependent enzyme [Acidobacteriota bacterium]MDE3147698.1 aminotransferase class I/II-fold pyridoxal phosphate-dependent enzyme [Acidobacteriota bacterium]
MEFRRINGLPPYVFATINGLKAAARAQGRDIVDFGFGNPDLPSPDLAVEKLAEAAHNPKNHRYSASRGLPNLRLAMATRYKKVFDVDLDPETEVVTTIGAKEGLTHLMWVLLGPGDSAIVPSPSYPIHLAGPGFAGAQVITVPMVDPGASTNDPGDDFFDGLLRAWESATVKPRVIICSFPHNPTSASVDLAFMERLVNFALEREVIICHDFAYADLGFDGYQPPSILQVPRAKECCVELYTLTKSFSMAGWRVGFMVGNAEIVAALTKLKSYLDYGTFQPVQIAAIVAMNEASHYPDLLREVYQVRRDTLIGGLNRIGWNVAPPKGSMFIWAPIPEAYREMSSLEFATFLITEAEVATSPGVGFGEGGDGHVRFALIENELRTQQAIRNLRRALPKLN